MRKGEKLIKVETMDGRMTVTGVNGSNIKLSRTERNILADYKNPNYVEDIIKVFGNSDVLADGFTFVKNGVIKFTYANKK